MFKKFDKVFKFTFRNQIKAGSYKLVTIGVALFLFLLPIIIFLIMNGTSGDGEGGYAPCGADKVYVVNEFSDSSDFSMLSQLQEENYTDITFTTADSVNGAISTIRDAGEISSLVLSIYKSADGEPQAQIIIPSISDIQKVEAENLADYLEGNMQVFTIVASGLSVQNLMELSMQVESDVYSAEGYYENKSIYDTDAESLKERDNNDILPGFNMILVYFTIMLVYFVVLAYGTSITQNVVLEKSSKLMDTMLLSVSPDSMIFGKMLGVLAAGMIQLFSWLAAVGLGIFAGVKIVDSINPDNHLKVLTFFKSLGELGLFKPLYVVLALLVLVFGIVLYCSIAAIGGAISSTKEEAASNQSIFVILLVICFYAVLMTGLNSGDTPTWLYIFPGTSAMVLPAGVCSGVVSLWVALAGFAVMVLTTIGALLLAGKMYKMMSLYKGNGVKLGKALKMLFASK